MKPPQTFEEQTECIVESLLLEFLSLPVKAQSRCLQRQSLQSQSLQNDSTDSGEPSSFDVTIIAARLRMLGDQINVEMEESVEKVMKEAATGQVVTVLQNTLKSLSQTWCAQDPNLAYERAFLAMTVKLLKAVSKKNPQTARQLAGPVRDAINGNSAVREYIMNQGGWENVEGGDEPVPH
ncbi:bcl-2-like protein 15 [Gracilinanus agilis]|uniref:bcl-2-like protein 15 n=1 Tax=Gracilinanus agilis TaxID=191870 RepID=UPI001CFD3B4F|nr:bcl-2-like protein 15 [Gracilinanus agilis]